MMKRNVQLGSQIFINKYDTPEQVREWVQKLSQSKMELIRLFMLWDSLEPEEGVWDFTNYDACFDEAEKLGIKIIPTLMANSPAGWMNLTASTQDTADLNNPEIWETGLKYVDIIVKRYAKSEALHSWILWNEPSWKMQKNKNSMRAFSKYLKKLYNNDIGSLNKAYYKKYKNFDQLAQIEENDSSESIFSQYTETLDWFRFKVDVLMEKLVDIKNRIRLLDSNHPVHVNPAGIATTGFEVGQSIWEEAKIADFMGCSAHPSWHSQRFLPDRIHQSVAYFADLMKSATRHPKGEFWVTELQGGTNIFSGWNKFLCPSETDVKHWLWEGIGAGASAVVFWCFNSRSGGFEAGEWALLDQRGDFSGRLKAVSEVAQVIRENHELFNKVKPAEPDVFILFSENSWRLGHVEGNGDDVKDPRNKQMAADALCGAYLICNDLGLNVAFVDEERFIKGEIPQGSTLLIPGAYSLEDDTIKSLERFTQAGGRIIADGLVGLKNPNGFVSKESKKILDRIFGAELVDIQAEENEFSLLFDKNTIIDGWFLKCIFDMEVSDKVIAKFSDGRAGALSNSFGLGNASRIGTVFFQRYLSKPTDNAKNLLKDIIGENSSKKIILENPSFNLRIKVLETAKENILIILNRGREAKAPITFKFDCKLEALDKRISFDAKQNERVEFILEPEEVRIYRVRKV